MSDYRKVARAMISAMRAQDPALVSALQAELKKEEYYKDTLAYITDDYNYKKTLDEFPQETKDIAEAIAERLVFEGDFDTNATYWDNIKALYDEITSADCDPDIIPA